MNDPVTIWVGVIVTLTVLSYLVKDNVFYRLVQKSALGATTGILIILTWKQILYPYWFKHIIEGFRGTNPWGILWLLALIPGVLFYFQMSKKWFWLSRPVIALFIGVAAGRAFIAQILLILPQIKVAIKPLNPWLMTDGLTTQNALVCLNNLLFMAGFFTTLLYFCFTIKSDSKWLKAPMSFGRMTIMVALGAMFGNTVMTRMAFLIERIQFLYQNFYGLFTQ
jgi:hypothetical protein